MKIRVPFAFVLLLAICGPALAQNPAGILLYFESGSEVYLLVAEDHKKIRGWSGFGGRAKEGESLAETAARETEEETRGYFARADLMKKITEQEALMDNRFALFFAEIDFVPAQLLSNLQPPAVDAAYDESGPYAWIPFSHIVDYVRSEVNQKEKYPVDKRYLPSECKTDWFWPVWLHTVRKAVEKKALPWKQEEIPNPIH